MKRTITCLIFAGIVLSIAPALLFAQGMEKTSAKLYLKQEEYDKAIEWAQKAIDKKPEDAESHFLLGKAYAFSGNLKGMIREFDLFEKYDEKKKKDDERKEAENLKAYHFAQSFNKGVEAFNKQDFDNAAQQFNIASMLDTTSTASYQNMALAFRQLEAQIMAGDCADCDTANVTWNAETNQCEHVSSGEAVKTCCCGEAAAKFLSTNIVDTYQKLIALQPDTIDHYLQLSDYYRAKENFEASVTLLKKVQEKDPTNSKVLTDLAISYDLMGEADEAFNTYEQAIKQNPENVDIRFNFGRLYLMREDYTNAMEQFKHVASAYPDDFDSNYNVGYCNLKIGEVAAKKAQEMEEEASNNKTKPDQATLDSLRAVAKESFEASIPFLEKASELKPDQSAVWFNLAVAYTRTGANEKAKAAFDKAEALDPDSSN